MSPHPDHHDPRLAGDPYRDENGQIRRENGNKLVRTLEKEYGVDLGVRGDMKLSTALDHFGVSSQTQLLKKLQGR